MKMLDRRYPIDLPVGTAAIETIMEHWLEYLGKSEEDLITFLGITKEFLEDVKAHMEFFSEEQLDQLSLSLGIGVEFLEKLDLNYQLYNKGRI